MTKKEEPSVTEQQKADFLARIYGPQQMQVLFNHLPDVYFFAKNRAGKFMIANNPFVRQCGAECEEEIIGKDDSDFFPADRAATYMADDRHVMETGQSIINRVELAPDPRNSLNWFVTTKVPIYSSDGEIMGLAGTTRDITRTRLTIRPYTEMRVVLEYVDRHYAEPIEVKQLAEQVNLSVSQFERRFRSVFQISPLKHVMNVRLRAASLRLIVTNDTIAAIAHDCGFYDHSHFTRNFRKHMNTAPKEYRRLGKESAKPK